MFSQVGRDIENMVILWTIPIFPIPPAPAIFDQRVIGVGSIGQNHLADRAPKLVLAECVESHFFPEDELRGGVLVSRFKCGS
jgi:hypothetical protein